MVLPLLPVVNNLNDVENVSGQLTKSGFNAIGQIMFHSDTNIDSKIESIAKMSMNLDVVVDIEGLSVDQLIQLFDAGAAKVVVSKTQLLELNDIPAERILVRLSEEQVATPAGIEDIANSVSGIIIDSSFTLSCRPRIAQIDCHFSSKDLSPDRRQEDSILAIFKHDTTTDDCGTQITCSLIN